MSLYAVTVLLIIASASVRTFVSAEQGSNCECGLFAKGTPDPTSNVPIVTKAPKFEMTCDDAGKANCSNMCKALAEASKQKEGPEKLCDLVGDAEHFVPQIYYKACGDAEWRFTGLQPTVDVCCKGKAMVACS